MRLIILILSMMTCILEAQEVKVGRIRQLTKQSQGEYYLSAISPDSRQLLVTSPNFKGISLIAVKGRRLKSINDIQGAGFEPSFSSDGRFIFFREDQFPDQKKFSSILSYSIATGETKIIIPESRNLSTVVVSGNGIFYLSDGRVQKEAIEGEALKSYDPQTLVLLEDLTPVLYHNGEKKVLKPNGNGSYIWVSLSPDKSKVLYYFTGKGTFVCDLEGNIICAPGRVNAPKWLTNDVIIGMDDRDDGYRVTSSELVYYSLNSDKLVYLTSTSSRSEMYPFPFPDGRGIAFQTDNGELYIMKIKIK